MACVSPGKTGVSPGPLVMVEKVPARTCTVDALSGQAGAMLGVTVWVTVTVGAPAAWVTVTVVVVVAAAAAGGDVAGGSPATFTTETDGSCLRMTAAFAGGVCLKGTA